MIYIIAIISYLFIGCIILGMMNESKIDKIDFIMCLLLWPIIVAVTIGMYIKEKLG